MNCQCTCPDTPPAAYSRNLTDRSWEERYYIGAQPPFSKWENGRVFDNTITKETAIGWEMDGRRCWIINGQVGNTRMVWEGDDGK